MCCCGKPTINGEMGYRWQPNDKPSVRRPNPPELDEGDELLFDEPGRCGGVDCHSHHYRLVKKYGSVYLMVQHGGGRERIRLHDTAQFLATLANAGDQRYWTLHAIKYAHSDGMREAGDKESAKWRQAAAEKRIKTRKRRGSSSVKVWIEDRAPSFAG